MSVLQEEYGVIDGYCPRLYGATNHRITFMLRTQQKTTYNSSLYDLVLQVGFEPTTAGLEGLPASIAQSIYLVSEERLELSRP